METVDSTERLARLRELMKKYKVDVYSMWVAGYLLLDES